MIKMIMFDIKNSEMDFVKSHDLTDFEIKLSRESLNEMTKLSIKECDETSVVSVFVCSNITKKVLDKFKNLRIIATRSVSYNHIDLDECRKRNIAVINTSNYGKYSVSQYVLGLILALQRKIFLAAAEVKKEKNIFENYIGNELNSLTLGVIGTGSIGSEVCKLAHNLGMKVLANDVYMNEEIKDFAQYVSFTDLLRKSDIVTIHIPYVSELKSMFSVKEFEIMKETGFLINTSQGEFIDYSALYWALSYKKISGAALDIVINEKYNIFGDINKKPDYEELERNLVNQKLAEMDNVIITPEIAYATQETLNKIIFSNFNDIKDFYKGRKTNRII